MKISKEEQRELLKLMKSNLAKKESRNDEDATVYNNGVWSVISTVVRFIVDNATAEK